MNILIMDDEIVFEPLPDFEDFSLWAEERLEEELSRNKKNSTNLYEVLDMILRLLLEKILK